jgi:hypothetical protein
MSYSIPHLSRKTPVLCLLYSGQRTPLYLYIIMCTVQCVVYLRTKDRGMISSVHLFCYVHIFRRSFALLILDLF